MPRILWVVPRFGADIVGGAEMLVRTLVGHLNGAEWEMEVATTCAIDHVTWENALQPGVTIDDGVTVRRFLAGARDARRYAELHVRVLDGSASYLDELEWFANGVWSPDLQQFLEREGSTYELVVFAPYLFGTTVWGVQALPERAVVLPCLHDEPYARLRTTTATLRAARGCIFNTHAEEALARGLVQEISGGVVGVGFDPQTEPAPEPFAARNGLDTYLLYAGRLEEGKRVHVAVDYALRYAQERAVAPTLVLAGRGDYRPPASDVIKHVGFLSEEDKQAALSGCFALVNPSHLESLSLTLLECWRAGRPALVARGSTVLREHAEQSGGGLLFGSYPEYRDALDRLLADPGEADRLGRAGRAYVDAQYSWGAVRDRFRSVLASLQTAA